MSEKREAALFRRERAHELRALAGELQKHKLIKDPTPLNAAAGLVSGIPANPLGWSYKLEGLLFEFETPRNTFPQPGPPLIEVELTIDIEGRCLEIGPDPFTRLSVSAEIHGEITAKRSNSSSWHIDRHLTGGDAPSGVHPLYHFQYGGWGMAPLHQKLGSTLLLDPPRVFHPPMDAVLAIDFVISNYDWKARLRLIEEESTYYERLLYAQRLFWRPYVETIAAAWNTPLGAELWPQLV